MKIQLLSDLHIEFYRNNPFSYMQFQTDAKVLVLAGDINSGRTNTIKSLKVFADMYEHVIYVHGNHELYGGHIDNFEKLDITKLPSNVSYLNRSSVAIDGIYFIGAPLWTNFGKNEEAALAAKRYINDFRVIEGATTDAYAERHEKDVEYIFNVYSNAKGNYSKFVIVTHWMPAIECVHPKYCVADDRVTLLLNKYFANNLGNRISNLGDTVWMFGHTHTSTDMYIGDVRCLSNPAGYPNTSGGLENQDFNPHFTIEV